MVVNLTKRLLGSAWSSIFSALIFSLIMIISKPGIAATYAALVMDARDGSILHSENADQRLHPASLTKMMTLYVAFEAVENGEISLDKKIKTFRLPVKSLNSRMHERLNELALEQKKRNQQRGYRQ